MVTKDIDANDTGATRIAPRLLVVADRAYAGDDARWLAALRAAGEAARGEPVWIQVRAKQFSGKALIDLAARAREAIPAGVPALLNADASLAPLAASLGYDGVHWPEQTIPDPLNAGAHPLDGLRLHSAAIHSVDALCRAAQTGADCAVFGAVYAPGSKPGAGVGIEALRAMVSVAALPVIAIGGVTPDRVGACIEAGAYGVAAVSGILGTASPGDAVRTYLAALAAAVETTNVHHLSPMQRGGAR